MKRTTALFLSTVITVLLVITVLAAGQPHAQASTQPASAAVVTGAVQSAPASNAVGPAQSEGSHREHQSRRSFNTALSDD